MPIHSGCQICPMRIIFNMTYEGDKSILYYKNVLEKENSSKNLSGERQNFKQKIA